MAKIAFPEGERLFPPNNRRSPNKEIPSLPGRLWGAKKLPAGSVDSPNPPARRRSGAMRCAPSEEGEFPPGFEPQCRQKL